MVKHIMRDGTVLEDIAGHVVKEEEARMVYEIIDTMNQTRRNYGDNSQQEQDRQGR